MPRKKIPEATITEVLLKSRRRCALCYGLDRSFEIVSGQIAHIDQNNNNPDFDNLVFLCLAHHDQYDSRTSQSKNFTQAEIKAYRNELYRKIDKEFAMSDKQLFNTSYEPDKYNGVYTYESPNQEATIEIRHVKDDLYSINGTSFYGTKRPGGPNIGELSEIGVLKNNCIIYTDFNYSTNEIDYSIKIIFNDDGIHVEETASSDGILNRFGLGAYFGGDYKKQINNV